MGSLSSFSPSFPPPQQPPSSEKQSFPPAKQSFSTFFAGIGEKTTLQSFEPLNKHVESLIKEVETQRFTTGVVKSEPTPLQPLKKAFSELSYLKSEGVTALSKLDSSPENEQAKAGLHNLLERIDSAQQVLEDIETHAPSSGPSESFKIEIDENTSPAEIQNLKHLIDKQTDLTGGFPNISAPRNLQMIRESLLDCLENLQARTDLEPSQFLKAEEQIRQLVDLTEKAEKVTTGRFSYASEIVATPSKPAAPETKPKTEQARPRARKIEVTDSARPIQGVVTPQKVEKQSKSFIIESEITEIFMIEHSYFYHDSKALNMRDDEFIKRITSNLLKNSNSEEMSEQEEQAIRLEIHQYITEPEVTKAFMDERDLLDLDTPLNIEDSEFIKLATSNFINRIYHEDMSLQDNMQALKREISQYLKIPEDIDLTDLEEATLTIDLGLPFTVYQDHARQILKEELEAAFGENYAGLSEDLKPGEITYFAEELKEDVLKQAQIGTGGVVDKNNLDNLRQTIRKYVQEIQSGRTEAEYSSYDDSSEDEVEEADLDGEIVYEDELGDEESELHVYPEEVVKDMAADLFTKAFESAFPDKPLTKAVKKDLSEFTEDVVRGYKDSGYLEKGISQKRILELQDLYRLDLQTMMNKYIKTDETESDQMAEKLFMEEYNRAFPGKALTENEKQDLSEFKDDFTRFYNESANSLDGIDQKRISELQEFFRTQIQAYINERYKKQ